LKKLLAWLAVVAAAALMWGLLRKREPPKIDFTRATRQTLVSTLPTNGKVEPFEWQAVRVETAGLVSRVTVQDGQTVAQGAELARMSDPPLQTGIDTAEAKVAEARANLAAAEAGGRPAELTDIENNLERSRMDLRQQQIDYDSLRRLADKQAATNAEVQNARDKVQHTELAIEGLEQRRASLVAKPDVAANQARLRDAEVVLEAAKARAALIVVRSPLAGAVYGLAARAGAWLNVGDLVANVGRLDRLRVRVYVDEPELGRVAVGQPVTIAWQALSGRQWQGTVERKPTSIEPLGSRQVGEVVCTIENPGRELIPGTNVDAEIRTAVVDHALVIPRETLRHDAQGDYVLALKGDTVERRAVKTGASTISLVEVTAGLADGDGVALPSETSLQPGARVTPVMATGKPMI
jgi:HlyD family secretion protein